MGSDPTLTRVVYLEKVINNIVLPNIMAKNNQNKKSGAVAKGPAPDSHLKKGIDPSGSGSAHGETTTTCPWALKLPRYKVPTEYGLKLITKEVLEADPDLLAYMLEHHADCFDTLPTTADPSIDPPAPQDTEDSDDTPEDTDDTPE